MQGFFVCAARYSADSTAEAAGDTEYIVTVTVMVFVSGTAACLVWVCADKDNYIDSN